jgi:hypothetical protein
LIERLRLWLIAIRQLSAKASEAKRSINDQLYRPILLSLVQSDAGTDPGFVFVEINSHHLALTHSDKIIDQNRFALLRPNEHHS